MKRFILWFRKRRVRWRIANIGRTLSKLESTMKKAGFNRHERRQMIRDLVKDVSIGLNILNKLERKED